MIEKLIITDALTIRKKVHAHIREQILSGKIGPNERLIEARIARDIGTSRTPVREALHSLELEGLIESIPRVGYRVKQITDSEAVEIWEIRSLIEGLAGRWACEKSRERLARELKKNIALSEQKVREGEVTAFVDLDGQFHEIIARLSGGRRLLELAQSLRRYALRYRLESIGLPDTALRAIEGHKNILMAIEKNDPEMLSCAIGAHLEQSKRDTLRYAFQGDEEKKKEV